ncbi:MAG TPA: PAS domain-containing protein [Kiloniellaceae bacterium]|nr:PAS domain-containing protein [Kiloniellaceae bacterium]
MRLYDYWLARSSAEAVMPRDALDPAEITPLLKNLILAEVGDDGGSIRYRLVGTEIVAAHGFDYTGWTVERLTQGDTLAFTRRLYGAVVTRALPVYSEGHFRWVDKEYHWTKRLHLPLSRNGDGRVDLVLAGQFYEQARGRGELVLPARPEEVAGDRAALA